MDSRRHQQLQQPTYQSYTFTFPNYASPAGNSSGGSSGGDEQVYYYHEGRKLPAAGLSPFPADEEEMERLENVHTLTHAVLGSNFFGPVDRLLSKPSSRGRRKVIDVGTGTGSWTRDMATSFPQVDFLGIDIVPVPSPAIPPFTGSLLGSSLLSGIDPTAPAGGGPGERPNVRFERGDLNNPSGLPYRNGEFDVVHCRSVMGLGVPQYIAAIGELTRILRPGGMLLLAESSIPFSSSDGKSYNPTSASAELIAAIQDALRKSGVDPEVRTKLEAIVRAGPFDDVMSKELVVPLGEWPKDPRMQKLGRMGKEVLVMTIRGLTPLLRQRGYDDGMLSWLVSRLHAELDSERTGSGHGVASVSTYIWARKRMS